MIEAGFVVIGLLLVAVVIILAILFRRVGPPDLTAISGRLDTVDHSQERVERTTREEFSKNREESREQARSLREEVAAAIKSMTDSTVKALGEISTAQQNQLEGFSSQLAKLNEASQDSAKKLREEITGSLKGFSDSSVKSMAEIANMQKTQLETFSVQLAKLMESNEKRFENLRVTVEQKLGQIQLDNTTKLEEMRKTVDEKLQGTLEKRLGESFKQVSERLEQVYKGLGEMQTLATGVGDLKKVLTNVKTRGTWGEVQLGTMLEQVLNPDQYSTNVATKNGGERVEFAVRLPGHTEDKEEIVWLPIDAKFPTEDYQRLVEAQEKADPVAAEVAVKQLEICVKSCARDIRDKYLNPPKTTDFGILFLPVEGLFAEVIRRTGLCDLVQREFRVVIAGPTTLWSLLNSLQMGFRTLAIQKRSSEVWNLLAAVKTEWGKYGDVLDKVQKKLTEASNTIEDVAKRSKAIGRKLKDIQELPASEAQTLLTDESREDREETIKS